MAEKLNLDFENEQAVPETEDMPIEEAPQAEVVAPEATKAAAAAMLYDLQNRASHKTKSDSGPAARPGRFVPRRPGSIHSVERGGRIDDEVAIKNQETKIEIYQSYLNKRILSGKVVGVKQMFDRNAAEDNLHYYTIVTNGSYRVYIPIEKFTDSNMDEFCRRLRRTNPDKTLADAIKVYLEKRLGAEIDYVVTTLPEDNLMEDVKAVIGSRVEAMRRTRIYHWFGTTTDGHYLINIGDKAEARIVATASQGIRIEIFGVETFIPAKELHWNFVSDARSAFKVGGRVVVAITDIRRDADNDYKVEFDASVKRAQPDPRIEGVQIYQDGGVYVGTINYIRLPTESNPKASPAVFVKLDEGVQCMCPFPNGSVAPYVGAQVFVRITGHTENNYHIYGLISHIADE